MADYYSMMDEADARRRIAERLAGMSQRMVTAPRSEPYTVVRGSGGMPDIVVANKYAGAADAVNQFSGEFLGMQADRALGDSERRRNAALQQLLGEVDSGQPLDVRRAVALSQMGIDPRVIKAFSPGNSEQKDYLRANLSSIASSPAAIRAAELAGLITSEQAQMLVSEWERGQHLKQVDYPTAARANRLAMEPTDNSLIAAGMPGGAPVAQVGGSSSAPPRAQAPQPKSYQFTGKSGKPLVWADRAGNYYMPDETGELRQMTEEDFGGQQFEVADEVLGDTGSPVQPMPSTPAAPAPTYNTALEAVIASEKVPEVQVKRIQELTDSYDATRNTRAALESAYSNIVSAPEAVFGDKAQTAKFLFDSGADAGGTVGQVMQWIGEGMTSPQAKIVNQNLLTQKLQQMKMLGGSDTEKEFLWLSQNMPSAFTDPKAAKAFMENMVRALKITERVQQKRLEDAKTRIPGTRMYRDSAPGSEKRSYYDEAVKELGFDPTPGSGVGSVSLSTGSAKGLSELMGDL